MSVKAEVAAAGVGLSRCFGWLRRNALLLIFCALLILQFLTWRSTEALRAEISRIPRNLPTCDVKEPCIIELTPYTIKQLKQK